MPDSAGDALLVFRWYVWHSERFQMLKHHHQWGTATVYAPAVGHANKRDVPLAMSSTRSWIFCTNQRHMFIVFRHKLSTSLLVCSTFCLLYETQGLWRYKQAATIISTLPLWADCIIVLKHKSTFNKKALTTSHGISKVPPSTSDVSKEASGS